MRNLFIIVLFLFLVSCSTPKYYLVPLRDNPRVRVYKTKKEIRRDIRNDRRNRHHHH